MNKNCWISKTRCTRAEDRAVDLLAHIDYIARPDALRTLIREGAKRLGIWELACGVGLPGGGAATDPDCNRTLVDTQERYEAEVKVEP